MSAPVDVLAVLNKPVNASFVELVNARAAVTELMEAVQLRVEWINGSWYVLHADGGAWTNVRHGTEAAAQAEIRAALDAALARCKGGAA